MIIKYLLFTPKVELKCSTVKYKLAQNGNTPINCLYTKIYKLQ